MPDRPTLAERTSRLAERVAGVQARFWWGFAGAAFALTIVLSFPARRIEVDVGLEDVLGRDAPAVRNATNARRRLSTGDALEIGIEGTPVAVERFADELERALRQLPTDLVRAIDVGVSEERAFVLRHPFLYADLADVRRLRDALQERLERARLRENPFANAPTGPVPPLVDLRASLGARLRALEAFPGGRFASPDGRLRAIAVFADAEADEAAFVAAVEGVVARLAPERRAPPIRVEIGGEPAAAVAEQAAVERDVRRASFLAGAIVLLVLYFFFFRLRALVLLAISLAMATVWTLAVSRLVGGSLHAATALLAPVVLFHGVTDSISLLARYLEERRGGAKPERAIALAQYGTAGSTFTSSAAAAAAYAALAFAGLRGYRDFGILGLSGMTASWIAAHGVLPSLLVGLDRVWPLVRTRSRGLSGFYGAPFAWIASRAPRVLAWVGALLFVASAGVATRWIMGRPIEDDVSRTRPASWVRSHRDLPAKLDRALRGRGAPIAQIPTGSPDEAEAIATQLARIRLPGTSEPLFGPVLAAQRLLPDDQEEKLEVYAEIRSITRALASEGNRDEKAGVVDVSPPADLEPLELSDLPPAMAGRFADRQGRPGVVVTIGRGEGPARDPESAPYLSKVADAIDDLHVESGQPVHATGRPILVAAVFDAFRGGATKLVAWALAAVVLVTLFAFRRARLALVAAGTMLGGIAIMLAIAALRGERLQPLSILALPVTFGVGVDYAVHLVRRYAEEGSRTSGALLRETGAVLVVTSGTTLSAYLALTPADHQSIAAFGRLATYGEIACLAAALLVLPALLEAVPRRTLVPEAAAKKKKKK